MKKIQENNLLQTKEQNNNNYMDEFNFILNRSEKIFKIKNINNKVKEINYSYSSTENYSDEILNYLTQTIDKANQYKYNHSLNDSNSNNNFKIYNTDYISDIDAFYQYELAKRKIHYNKKAFNVHENRKIPYEEQNRQFHRRNFNDRNHQNNHYNNNNNNNRRNYSVDIFNRGRNEEKKYSNTYKNKKNNYNNSDYNICVCTTFNPDFQTNNNYNEINNNYQDHDRNKCLDRINFGNNFHNKNRQKFFRPGLISYNNSHVVRKNNFNDNYE